MMGRKSGVLVAVLVLFSSLLLADSSFVPSKPKSRYIPFTLTVRKADPNLPRGKRRELVPGAKVKLAALFKSTVGPSKMVYLEAVTNDRGECRFAIDPAIYASMSWACEVEKRMPDGKILRDVGLPAWGDVRGLARYRETVPFIRITVYIYDINSEDWPLGPRPYDQLQMPLIPPDDLDSSGSHRFLPR